MNLEKVGKGFLSILRLFLKVQYGENLFQPSKQKCSIDIALAKQCEDIGLTLKQCEGKSDRVCRRKIKALSSHIGVFV